MPRDEKVAMLKESLAAIGKRIEHVLNQKEAAGEDRDRWRRHLWTYVFSVLFFSQSNPHSACVLDSSHYFGPRKSKLLNWRRFTPRW